MISLARYAAVFAHPELRAAVAASIIGRLPIGITGLSILLLVQRATGSFAESGAMTAALLAVVLGYATAFGLVEIGITAYASETGRPALAGTLLALMSAGSALGDSPTAVVLGARRWRGNSQLHSA